MEHEPQPAGAIPGEVSQLEDAFAASLRALGRRERTAAEMERWLRGQGLDDAAAGQVLAQLSDVGAIDDRRFAERFARDKRELAGWGDGRIRAGLLGRGISADLVEAALQTAEGSELQRALEALERRGRALSGDPERQRALAFLVRRGYDLDLAYEAVRRYGQAAA